MLVCLDACIGGQGVTERWCMRAWSRVGHDGVRRPWRIAETGVTPAGAEVEVMVAQVGIIPSANHLWRIPTRKERHGSIRKTRQKRGDQC